VTILGALTILRCVALLACAAPMLMRRTTSHQSASNVSRLASRLPFVANVGSCGLFGGLLIARSGDTEGVTAVLLAGIGSVLALGGSAVVLWSRVNLGEAWSFIPRAAEQSGPVMTGPYRLVRHPIYLGLSVVAAGQAIAFSSGPALFVVIAAVIPTFLWRARVEEDLLVTVWRDRYLDYRARTNMMIPYVF
jgi:protein-S-isoprenylcysteine O-methyltransferase Ste14